MEKIIDKSKCCGCTACYNACPKKAITMEKNVEGFVYPKINQQECINCGLCKKKCPVLNTSKNSSLNKCYVGYAKEKKVKKSSSSGGIFPILAKKIIEEDGIVIGAAFNNKMKLEHIAIERLEDLEQLKGSKYIQSSLNNIFQFIKENISDKKILFVGTPCQVAGLKIFLKNDYNNLLCIDLFCHGVPSQKLFDLYLENIEKREKSRVIKYNFRDKDKGWQNYSNTILLSNNKKISELKNNNIYMNLFLSDNALRESCYDCNFKLGNKYSDITLGDFWGVQDIFQDMYSDSGVSAIIINSPNGEKFFESIKDSLYFKPCQITDTIKRNQSLVKSSNRTLKRDRFYIDLDKKGFNFVKKKYLKKTNFVMKIKNKITSIVKQWRKK